MFLAVNGKNGREREREDEGEEKIFEAKRRVGDCYLRRSRFMPLFAIGNEMQMRKSALTERARVDTRAKYARCHEIFSNESR